MLNFFGLCWSKYIAYSRIDTDSKMKKYLFVAFFLSTFILFAKPASLNLNSSEIQHEKIYSNPVIHADYSDPDVVASPDSTIFYMTASSFEQAPGLPILKSTDLVKWQLVNYALKEVPPVEVYGDGRTHHGKGVWAPCIKYHNGEYYIYWGDPDFGIFMIKTDNPEGEWSTPILVKSGKGFIDPTPFWDEDGKAYIANGWAASRVGFNSVITINEMTPDGTSTISEPVIIYDANDGVNYTMEGPKLYKKNGYYYLFAPAGGVAQGWQTVLRSKDIYGPYEAKIVMKQGASPINGPHQGAWVTTDAGEDWFLHFQDKGPYGRVVHLNPMKWHDDWPVIGVDEDGDGCGEPVTQYRYPKIKNKYTPQHSEENIVNQFQWHANRQDIFGFKLPGNLLRIYSHQIDGEEINLWEVPNLWLAKFPAETFSFITNVKISSKYASRGVSSGIVIMGIDYCRLGLTVDGDKFLLQLATCHDAENGGKEEIKDIAVINPSKIYGSTSSPNMEAEISFKIEVDKNAECHFFYSLNKDSFVELPMTFHATHGRWIGAKVGFYSIMPQNISGKGWIDIRNVILE